MNRRAFLRRAVPTAVADPPFEFLPGRYSDARLPIRWTAPPPRPDEDDGARPTAEPLRTTTGLEPYVPSADAPWDRRRALHLLRRIGFGATPQAVEAVLAEAPGAAVDAIVDAALAAPMPAVPAWADESPPPEDAPPAEVEA
ncbi:MAG: hypothetical protein R3362_08750, partial [Rhodothermales bacterium]|nr:hypothetical protein [Rhodothermales bacterium]